MCNRHVSRVVRSQVSRQTGRQTGADPQPRRSSPDDKGVQSFIGTHAIAQTHSSHVQCATPDRRIPASSRRPLRAWRRRP